MKINKELEETKLTIYLEGRFDTASSPMLEEELKDSISELTELIFDFEKVEYISSSGLRIILSAQKVMNKQGTMIVRHVNDVVMEVFEITGFVDILTIE